MTLAYPDVVERAGTLTDLDVIAGRRLSVTLAERWGIPVVTVTARPAVVNLRLYGGDDFAIVFTLLALYGPAILEMEAAAAAEIRRDRGGELVGEFDVEVAGDLVAMHLSHERSALLPEAAVYDVKLDLGGWVTTIATGSVSTILRVTEWPT